MARNLIGARPGVTLLEVMAVTASLAAVVAVITPALSRLDDLGDEAISASNLRVLARVNACYAADWGGRQFTSVPDDLGLYNGDCDTFEFVNNYFTDLLAGSGCDGAYWAFWGSCAAIVPMPFDGNGGGASRVPNAVGLHDYIDSDRFYDPVYYAPADQPVYSLVAPVFGIDCEYEDPGDFGPSTYVFSPAAMYHPEVLRAPSLGGFRGPASFGDGFESPAVSQVLHPALKTRMIEHHWLVDPPGQANPGFDAPYQFLGPDNSPYLFNHGADAEPLALFFDGSISTIRTGQVVLEDQELQDAGEDGLWSRDTPLGATGYFGEFSFDGTLASHHMLTTDGILGRDRIAVPAGAGDRP